MSSELQRRGAHYRRGLPSRGYEVELQQLYAAKLCEFSLGPRIGTADAMQTYLSGTQKSLISGAPGPSRPQKSMISGSKENVCS